MITLFCIHPKGFNVGNEVIHLALRHLLHQAFGRVVNVISLPAISRFESHVKAGLSSKTIHEINQYGHGVIVGGGNLYENGQLTVDGDALPMLEPPMLLFSLSRGRIHDRNWKLVTRTDVMPDRTIEALNRKASFSLARDQATYDHLQGLGIEKCQLGACPTIFIDQVADRLPRLTEGDRSGVLLSVRNPELMNIPLRRQASVRDDITRLIAFLRDLGLGPIRLLCHDHRDIPFATTFSDIEYLYTGDVYYYLSLLRTCTLSVSYRLHATLPCMSFGTPSINISYDERCQSLMETVGLGDWNIEMTGDDDVVAQVADRYRRLEELPEIRAGVRAHWDSLQKLNLDVLKQFRAQVEELAQVND
ncbi:colanic acid biosynthesis protein [Planctomycetes bacterium Pan216]|uniref:Colanic acid biosynthesis protein n=1 Tax=Kolteria novifilia TaxID=2527975 RepID=A0A518B3M0_9BACT|nr:colanic acid biosynthesis protein [Planctomycetes bacterium Pan216]